MILCLICFFNQIGQILLLSTQNIACIDAFTVIDQRGSVLDLHHAVFVFGEFGEVFVGQARVLWLFDLLAYHALFYLRFSCYALSH